MSATPALKRKSVPLVEDSTSAPLNGSMDATKPAACKAGVVVICELMATTVAFAVVPDGTFMGAVVPPLTEMCKVEEEVVDASAVLPVIVG